jgi:ubiquinone/menaquinone biosynthesis C-methylase UbiE
VNLGRPSVSETETARKLANSVVCADLVDLGSSEPAFAGVLMPRSQIGAAKIGITEQFLQQAGTYHERYSAVPYFRSLLEQATEGRLKSEPSIIFDIGSGSGNSVLPCLDLFPTARIVATDLSESLLAIMRGYITDPSMRGRLALVCIDATQCEVVERSADLVVGAAILHHLIDPSICVRQACRALKPGGIAVFFEPFENGNAILRLAYQEIIERAAAMGGTTLSPAVSNCLKMLVEDFRVRAGSDKSAPIFQRIDDKWLFTRTYFESLASELNVTVTIDALNQSDTMFVTQTVTNLRLALGLPMDHAIRALPTWAWDVLGAIDMTFSRELKRDLPIEARVVFTRAEADTLD